MKYVQEERKGKSFGKEIHPRGLDGEGGKDGQKVGGGRRSVGE